GEDSGGKPGHYPPNFGSILARHRGSSKLPAFISLTRGPIGDGVGPIFGHGGGTWGQTHDPFLVSCSETGQGDGPELKLFDGLTPERLGDRRAVMAELDRLRRDGDRDRFKNWDDLQRRAYALLASREGREAFDLSREKPATREAYGQTSFGQSCLLG